MTRQKERAVANGRVADTGPVKKAKGKATANTAVTKKASKKESPKRTAAGQKVRAVIGAEVAPVVARWICRVVDLPSANDQLAVIRRWTNSASDNDPFDPADIGWIDIQGRNVQPVPPALRLRDVRNNMMVDCTVVQVS